MHHCICFLTAHANAQLAVTTDFLMSELDSTSRDVYLVYAKQTYTSGFYLHKKDKQLAGIAKAFLCKSIFCCCVFEMLTDRIIFFAPQNSVALSLGEQLKQ